MTVPVDHDFVTNLVEAGMPVSQAEALARNRANLINTGLITKRDLRNLKRDVIVGTGTMLAIATVAIAVSEKLFEYLCQSP